MISWPKTLPLPTVEGYSIQPHEAISRTEFESGPARQRRRFTQVPTNVNVRWILTRAQLAIFEGWYRWQAKEGGAWFQIELLGGIGLVKQEARFTRQFQAQLLNGVLWEIRSELEIRERPVLDKDLVLILANEELQGLMDAMQALHILVHQTLPNRLN